MKSRAPNIRFPAKSIRSADFGVDDPKLIGKNIKSLFPKKYAAPTIKTKYQGMLETEVFAALMEYQKGTDANTALRSAAERADKVIPAELKNTLDAHKGISRHFRRGYAFCTVIAHVRERRER
jgi:hypothetical protein